MPEEGAGLAEAGDGLLGSVAKDVAPVGSVGLGGFGAFEPTVGAAVGPPVDCSLPNSDGALVGDVAWVGRGVPLVLAPSNTSRSESTILSQKPKRKPFCSLSSGSFAAEIGTTPPC